MHVLSHFSTRYALTRRAKKIRREIERICSVMAPTTPSQVIIATETLSYGVNMAVHDVILYGTEFYTQTRFGDLITEPLSACAFHNMVGRAGRLGKTRGTASVYIMVPRNQDPAGILKDYYLEIFPPESRLYVRDDRSVQLKAENSLFLAVLKRNESEDPCWMYATLGASDFSYPFVRSVLDALRHLNISSGATLSASRASIPWESLLDLLGFSLYAGQFLRTRSDTKELERFSCALQRILNDCLKDTLGLVDREGDKNKVYRITPRGEAIIDTGTEIQTVEPLLTIVASFHNAWKNSQGYRPFPTEFYILCLLAQNEVFRQYIYYAPECRGRDFAKDWPEQIASANHQTVFTIFVESIKRIKGFSSEEAFGLAEGVQTILKEWEPLRKINSAYPNGAIDSLLRFFNGIIAWINLEDRSLVDTRLEGHELPDQFRSRMQGFRQFTELLHMKTLFLSKLLAKNTKVEELFKAEDERNLHLIASRLRLGCTSEAIPLFWPFSSDVIRKEAAKFLNNGITPSGLLSAGNPEKLVEKSVEIAPNKLKMLHQDLERFVKKEFGELKEEMTLVPGDDNDLRRKVIRRLWEEMETMFYTGVEEFRKKSGPKVGFDDLLRECMDFNNLQPDSPRRTDVVLGACRATGEV